MGIKHCRLSDEQQYRLLECFALGATARSAANLLGINKNTAAYFYHRVRVIIADHLDEISPFSGEIDLPRSDFRGPYKPGHAPVSPHRVPIFGLSAQGSRVYTEMISVSSVWAPATPRPHQVLPHSVVYAYESDDADIENISEFRNYRLTHNRKLIGDHPDYIKRIVNFWNLTKRHLGKYHGIPKTHFHLFLKECEFRFNFGQPRQLLLVLQDWVSIQISSTA